ncbi:MAG: single-stranded DNA-binding protein [Armatimonadetes bacterium]|nr:single-stranded DNA-binding protein [Armatimonadota bacterium]NIM23000.1 single-stranded DNA-binding protein [Armatimonadota bacterium]NIM66871.1 single-stranded DNA-binding protein [Armatimonadota bacterium]NIM75411.1 single-stranded DNA-binding protein [Armatimonadota bacterium]NIN05058.1 single-stranded DNA-binding protein [Armatimonadota bacterium]
MVNRVVLVGRLVADPELRYTPSGVAVARLRIAVDRPFTNQQGERETDFIDIVAWRQSAQFAADYLRKGRLIGVDGRLQVRSYTTQDGQRRRVWEVVADRIAGLDRAREEGAAPAARAQAEETEQEGAAPDERPDVFEGQ